MLDEGIDSDSDGSADATIRVYRPAKRRRRVPSAIRTTEDTYDTDLGDGVQIYVSSSVAALLRHLTCAICLQVLDKTVTAPCMHRFCRDCVEKWLRVGRHDCPECKLKVHSRRAFKRDNSVDDVVSCFIAQGTKEPPANDGSGVVGSGGLPGLASKTYEVVTVPQEVFATSQLRFIDGARSLNAAAADDFEMHPGGFPESESARARPAPGEGELRGVAGTNPCPLESHLQEPAGTRMDVHPVATSGAALVNDDKDSEKASEGYEQGSSDGQGTSTAV